ncbi:MAG: hypothetical protein ABIO43_00515 [Sphingomicrobium sp.]
MTYLWHFYWPALVIALAIGIAVGTYAYRRAPGADDQDGPDPAAKSRRNRALGAGCLAVLVVTALWHAPIGAAGRYAALVERQARAELVRLEMTPVQAVLERAPLRRTLLLSGPANDFQRSELVRFMGDRPGVSTARWVNPPSGASAWLPLIAEAMVLGIIAFLLGLLLSYLNELRRRSNAQWRW